MASVQSGEGGGWVIKHVDPKSAEEPENSHSQIGQPLRRRPPKLLNLLRHNLLCRRPHNLLRRRLTSCV
jgi:hypothetical protein